MILEWISNILQRFESSRHEVLHDKDQQRARNMIKEWILSLPTLPVKFFVKVYVLHDTLVILHLLHYDIVLTVVLVSIYM